MPDNEYNPLLYDANHTASSGTVEIPVDAKCNYCKFYPTSGAGNVTVFINSITNTPGLIICESTAIENKDGLITNLILSFGGTATINVKQVTYPRGAIIR